MEAALVKAVRSLAINRHSRLGENGRLTPNGGSCDLCNSEWEEAQAEDHAPDCLARPNLASALAAAGNRTAVPHNQREPESKDDETEAMRRAFHTLRGALLCIAGSDSNWSKYAQGVIEETDRVAVSPGKGEGWLTGALAGLDERFDRLLLKASDGERFILSKDSARNLVEIAREWLRNQLPTHQL